jgi:hypothetical protein
VWKLNGERDPRRTATGTDIDDRSFVLVNKPDRSNALLEMYAPCLFTCDRRQSWGGDERVEPALE